MSRFFTTITLLVYLLSYGHVPNQQPSTLGKIYWTKSTERDDTKISLISEYDIVSKTRRDYSIKGYTYAIEGCFDDEAFMLHR